MMRVVITSTQISAGYFMRLKYLFILISHPTIVGTRLPVYFSGISNFNPPILASWGATRAHIAVASKEGSARAPPIVLREWVWIGMPGVAVRDLSYGGS